MKPGSAMQSGAGTGTGTGTAESAFMARLRRPGHPARVTVATLSLKATYVTPTGRLCQLQPQPRHGVGAGGDSFSFLYVDVEAAFRTGRPTAVERDGFRLAAANIGLLREVMREVGREVGRDAGREVAP
jgi:hypothetical protein